MAQVILVIHMFLALAIIGLVLLQRSEGGGLGIGGSGGLGGLATPQGTANILSRTTAICAAGFFATSLLLGAIASRSHASAGLLDTLNVAPAGISSNATPGAPVSAHSPEAPAPGLKTPAAPAKPEPGKAPSVPVSE
jgi:preprotein translocase subunit SecG